MPDKYSKRKWKKYRDTIGADTQIPDITSIYYNP